MSDPSRSWQPALEAVDRAQEEETDDVGPIAACVDAEVREYLRRLGGHECRDLHALVLAEVEPALLRVVLEHCQGNQTRAARLLGLNRGTLRKKLLDYDIR